MSLLAELYQEAQSLYREIELKEWGEGYDNVEDLKKEFRKPVFSSEELKDSNEGLISRVITFIDDLLFRRKDKEFSLGRFVSSHKKKLDNLYKQTSLPKMSIPIPPGMKLTYLKTAVIFHNTHFVEAIPDLYHKMEKILHVVEECIKHPKDQTYIDKFRDTYYPTIGFLEKLNMTLHTALEETFEIKEWKMLNIRLLQDEAKTGHDLQVTTGALMGLMLSINNDLDRYGPNIKDIFEQFNKVIKNLSDLSSTVLGPKDLMLLKKIVIHDAQIWTLLGQFIQLCYQLDTKYTLCLGKIIGKDPTDFRK